MILLIETITWKPHVETAIEIAVRARDAGEAVLYCNLRNSLPACEDDSALHGIVDLPEVRIRRGLRLLGDLRIATARPGYSDASRRKANELSTSMMRDCPSIEDLKALAYLDFTDIGWGALSSIVSVTRDATVAPATHRDLFRRYLEASILVYDKTCELIDEHSPSLIVLFNGRFATTRAVLRAAQSRKVSWNIHERGGSKDRYWLTDCLPHDMDAVQQRIARNWSVDQIDEGHGYFQARRDRVEREWHSFTLKQVVGRLPPPMLEPGDWITFFTSSEDEMVAIGDSFQPRAFPTQTRAIESVAEAMRCLPGARLCVRVHPHIASKSKADRDKWRNFFLPDVLVLGPDDPADSYALMERSKVVCTYGSTVGIEATYWGRPSLLFCRAYYDRLGVCATAEHIEHVRSFLASPQTFPREATLAYGAFWSRLGIPYQHYQAEGLHRGSICGVFLDDSTLVRSARWVSGRITRLLPSRS